MCTVTFVHSRNNILITSNRDEQVLRLATEPRHYLINNKNLFFPKDPKAGGTWYVVDEQSNVMVLLNGAAEKHRWNPPYRRSRGLIVLDLFSAPSALLAWPQIDLQDIEPFTLVLYQDKKLYQLRWDGSAKSKLELNPAENHIWSSSTLYPEAIRAERAQWFASFLENKSEVRLDDMFQFHRYTESSNSQNGLVINRNDRLRTLSITQSIIEQNKTTVIHLDLIEERETTNTFLYV